MLEALQNFLIWAIVGACAGSFLLLLLHRKRIGETAVAKWLAIVTTLIAGAALIARIVACGRLPFMSGLDFSFWLCALILGASAVLTVRQKLAVIGYLTYPITCALGVWMTSFSLEETALAPALRSYWLDFHVSTAIISYTLFLFSFLFSVMLLVGGKKKYKSLPQTDVLNEWAYRACIIGLALLTIVIITGAVWAEYAWGSFWSWDPKETWALITWFIYAIYLHLRLRGWSETKVAWVNVIGLVAVLFTLFGVSYLLPGLHSYI